MTEENKTNKIEATIPIDEKLTAFDIEWPRIWVHKETKKKFNVMPWWECEEPIMTEKDKALLPKKRRFKIGALIQIGWLIENEHHVWMGLGPKVEDHFDDVTETERPKEDGEKNDEARN